MQHGDPKQPDGFGFEVSHRFFGNFQLAADVFILYALQVQPDDGLLFGRQLFYFVLDILKDFFLDLPAEYVLFRFGRRQRRQPVMDVGMLFLIAEIVEAGIPGGGKQEGANAAHGMKIRALRPQLYENIGHDVFRGRAAVHKFLGKTEDGQVMMAV